MPAYDGNEAGTAFVIIAVDLLSSAAMLTYPPLAQALGFDDLPTDILLGGAIHDVMPVAGAGDLVSEKVGVFSVIVKLIRVLL